VTEGFKPTAPSIGGFRIFDGVGKLLEVQAVIDGAKQPGDPQDGMFSLGATLLVCVLVYLVPRTALVGAVLLTG